MRIFVNLTEIDGTWLGCPVHIYLTWYSLISICLDPYKTISMGRILGSLDDCETIISTWNDSSLKCQILNGWNHYRSYLKNNRQRIVEQNNNRIIEQNNTYLIV